MSNIYPNVGGSTKYVGGSGRYAGRLAETDTTSIPSNDTTPLLQYAQDDMKKPASSYSSGSLATKENENKGGSVLIVVATVFLQSIGFTVTMPSMAYYVQELHIDNTWYGAIVSIYSVGQFLGSIVFGFWSNHAPTRIVIVASLIVSALGNVLYGFVADLPGPQWFMLLSRFLVGFGAGNVAVCRAYASEASTLANKAGNMAKMSMAQGMGFVVGPIIGTILSLWSFHIGDIAVNKYTSPGFVSAIFGIFNVFFAAIFFKELTARMNKDSKIDLDIEKPTRQEFRAMIVSIFLFFVVIAVFSVFETMITVITKADFGWTVKDNGFLFMAVGGVSVVVFAVISTPIMKRQDDRKMLLIGTVLNIIGLFTAVTWKVPHLQNHLTKPQFFIAALIIGIGYPIASAYMFAIYSKVLNPVYQGTKMGYLTAGGSLARMLGPLWAVFAYKYGGGELLFVGTNALVIVSLVILIVNYSLLAPHPSYFASIATPSTTSSTPSHSSLSSSRLSPPPHMSVNADDKA